MKKHIDTLELQEALTEKLTELETIREAAKDFVIRFEPDYRLERKNIDCYIDTEAILAFENLKELVN